MMNLKTKLERSSFPIKSPVKTILNLVLYNTGISPESVILVSQQLYRNTIGRL